MDNDWIVSRKEVTPRGVSDAVFTASHMAWTLASGRGRVEMDKRGRGIAGVKGYRAYRLSDDGGAWTGRYFPVGEGQRFLRVAKTAREWVARAPKREASDLDFFGGPLWFALLPHLAAVCGKLSPSSNGPLK